MKNDLDAILAGFEAMLEQKLPAITSAHQGAYAGIANHVKNVVLQEMVNQQRPGGLLYK